MSAATPPPIHKGQPLSVGLFPCGILRVCGGFCGNLRTSPRRPIGRSGPYSALSRPFFSRPRRRQNLEVRKYRNSGRYKSAGYSRTFQAVGWRHCLPGGNNQPETALYRSSRDAAARVHSIGRLMPVAGCTAASYASPWIVTIVVNRKGLHSGLKRTNSRHPGLNRCLARRCRNELNGSYRYEPDLRTHGKPVTGCLRQSYYLPTCTRYDEPFPGRRAFHSPLDGTA
jgi:hypothetical protein